MIKPLHTVQVGTTGAVSGPNDGAVIQPKPQQIAGMAVACGIVPRLSDVDPYLMAMASVDEAIRNLLCVGAEFGTPEAVTALVDNFCWPDPVQDPQKAGALVRACYGLREAALRLRTPLVSGKDSMKNDFRGKLRGEPITISVPPTLLMTAIGRVADTRNAKSADFKAVGGMRGIGWAALVRDGWSNRLYNVWINEHEGGHFGACPILLIMDVFEHAFLVDNTSKKADYVEAFFKNVNWAAVENRLG